MKAWQEAAEKVVQLAATEIGRQIGKHVDYDTRSFTRPMFMIRDASALNPEERKQAISIIERVWADTLESNADTLDFDRWSKLIDTRDLDPQAFSDLMKERRKRAQATETGEGNST